MSDPKLHDRGMTDTESVALAAKGYKPVLEQQYSSHWLRPKLSEKPYQASWTGAA